MEQDNGEDEGMDADHIKICNLGVRENYSRLPTNISDKIKLMGIALELQQLEVNM